MRHNWLVLVALMATPALALTVETPLPEPAQEARAQELFHEIRCVVCQGEAIADSPADVASDLRREIRLHIEKGDSDAAIKEYLVSRYGEVILMKPPVGRATLALWLGPWLLLAAALAAAWRYFRQTPSPLEGEGKGGGQ